jgi:hypothetical protein
MAKAARVLAAPRRDGWVETRRSGSNRVLVKGDQQGVGAYQDGVDLGGPAMSRIARALPAVWASQGPQTGQAAGHPAPRAMRTHVNIPPDKRKCERQDS